MCGIVAPGYVYVSAWMPCCRNSWLTPRVREVPMMVTLAEGRLRPAVTSLYVVGLALLASTVEEVVITGIRWPVVGEAAWGMGVEDTASAVWELFFPRLRLRWVTVWKPSSSSHADMRVPATDFIWSLRLSKLVRATLSCSFKDIIWAGLVFNFDWSSSAFCTVYFRMPSCFDNSRRKLSFAVVSLRISFFCAFWVVLYLSISSSRSCIWAWSLSFLILSNSIWAFASISSVSSLLILSARFCVGLAFGELVSRGTSSLKALDNISVKLRSRGWSPTAVISIASCCVASPESLIRFIPVVLFLGCITSESSGLWLVWACLLACLSLLRTAFLWFLAERPFLDSCLPLGLFCLFTDGVRNPPMLVCFFTIFKPLECTSNITSDRSGISSHWLQFSQIWITSDS